jgi:hypothetical protein
MSAYTKIATIPSDMIAINLIEYIKNVSKVHTAGVKIKSDRKNPKIPNAGKIAIKITEKIKEIANFGGIKRGRIAIFFMS